MRDVVTAPNACKEKNFTGMFPSLMSLLIEQRSPWRFLFSCGRNWRNRQQLTAPPKTGDIIRQDRLCSRAATLNGAGTGYIVNRRSDIVNTFPMQKGVPCGPAPGKAFPPSCVAQKPPPTGPRLSVCLAIFRRRKAFSVAESRAAACSREGLFRRVFRHTRRDVEITEI